MAMTRIKRERLDDTTHGVETHHNESTHPTQEQRRVLRSKYRDVIIKIHDKKEELVKPDSEKFNVIIDEVQNLYRQVQKPREQAADGEALLGLANSLATSVKSHSRGVNGITPSDFVSCLLRDFGESHIGSTIPNLVRWKDIGLAVSPIFMTGHGCNTMIGAMTNELKKRKAYSKRMRPIVATRPEELDDAHAEEKTDTDNNMLTMFEILKKKPGVVLESLILNRSSFAQTVENLFALSFLVRDGRVQITVKDNGAHLVSPKNSPDASSIASGEVNYSHFVFRFDFLDWKLMKDVVPVGEELMPHRSLPDPTNVDTPIRKFSSNRGKENASVVQECSRKDYVAAMKRLPLVAVVSSNSN